MNKLFIYFSLMLLLTSNAMSSVRTDVEDRPKEKVAKNAYHLGHTMDCTKTTVLIMQDKLCFTGVALDPYTVITCAHRQAIPSSSSPYHIILQDSLGNIIHGSKASQSPIIHPEYVQNFETAELNFVSFNKGTLNIHGTEIKRDDPLLTFDEIRKTPAFEAASHFKGVDLMILKLDDDTTLPKDLPYPEVLLDPNCDIIKDTYGVSVGYGILQYNNTEGMASTTIDNPELKRHLISTKVRAGFLKDATPPSAVLYGSYKGLVINGNESFITDSTMMKTEGLPVDGDSGGPFYIKHGDHYQLVGIFSQTITLYAAIMDHPDPKIRETLKDFQQPIYPVWVDIRAYWEWIKQHMG